MVDDHILHQVGMDFGVARSFLEGDGDSQAGPGVKTVQLNFFSILISFTIL